MFCPNCGNNNPDGTQFCSACGTKLSQPQPQYQQPQYQQPQYSAPAGRYQVNIKKRSIGMCILLSIITCGIYGIIWMISLADDLNTASGRTSDTSGGVVFLLGLVTCGIYTWYWLYKAGEKVDMIRSNNGEAPNHSSVVYLLLSIFGLGIVSYCLIQSELNKVATM